MKTDFDVIIIGGGPAGSTLASYLAKTGITCAIFEKEKFPRPHVGEALVASSTKIFQELGLINKLEASNFPKKYGAVCHPSGAVCNFFQPAAGENVFFLGGGCLQKGRVHRALFATFLCVPLFRNHLAL